MDGKLSVVIPVWQHHDLAKAHVRECMEGMRMPDEIIVINDGGEDDLLDKLKELEIKTEIVYAKILPPKMPWNYTGARNLGVWLSRGDYISIEDQDHIPHKEFYSETLKMLKEHPEANRCKSKWRWEVNEDEVVSKPQAEWKVLGGRQAHYDCAVITRELYLTLKGYDERFAGEYGWSNTNWRRRLVMANSVAVSAGFQYVINNPKTRGLSYRNWNLARKNKDMQPPLGMINFQYTFTRLKP